MKLLDNLGRDKRRVSLRSFAVEHKSLDELAPEYQEIFQDCIDPGQKIRHILTAPSQTILDPTKRFLLRARMTTTPEWGIVMTDERVLIVTIEEGEPQPNLTEISFEDVLSMTLGKILLYGWLEWRWTQNNQVQEMQIFFNTVEERLFGQLVKEICRYRIEQANLAAGKRDERLDLLDDLPYKFKNLIANRLLQDDEEIVSIVFSPAVWTRKLGLFRSLEKPAFTMLRTNYHVLVMREDYGVVGGKYGVVYQYFPLDSVVDAQLDQQDDQARISLILKHDGIEDTVQFDFNLQDTPDGLSTLSDFTKSG
jgi:hypothetical protein